MSLIISFVFSLFKKAAPIPGLANGYSGPPPCSPDNVSYKEETNRLEPCPTILGLAKLGIRPEANESFLVREPTCVLAHAHVLACNSLTGTPSSFAAAPYSFTSLL